MPRLARRDFLKGLALTLAGVALPPRVPLPSRQTARREPPPARYGRITTWHWQAVRVAPSESAELVAWRRLDEVIPLFASAVGEAPWPSNPVWYKTIGGWIHSGYVQPVEFGRNWEIVETVPKPGFWAEVCVPIASARSAPGSEHTLRKLYYGTVYRVVDCVRDDADRWWYQLQEGFAFRPGPFVDAAALRRISPSDVAPISRGRPDKRIVIDIQSQLLRCMEGPTSVFETLIGSGLPGTATPKGEFTVWAKRHTSRMVGGGPTDPYDLPGVAFPVYFTYSGVATHGTYWHNDYGRRHSHGCVNVTNEAARWIFRWADPVAPYSQHEVRTAWGEGTPVTVV